MGLLVSVFAGFGLAAAAPWLSRLIGRGAGYLLALLPLAITVYLGGYIGTLDDQPVTASYSWLPALGLNLSFYLDGLSLLFALLIAAFGGLVVIYSVGYIDEHPGLFYAYMLAFMASMLGLVLAGNLLTLYVFWELTTISSFLLIGFHHDRSASRAAAIQALMITAFGGLALLVAILLIGRVVGSYELTVLLESGSALRENALYEPILILLLIGAVTKSAQVPFHFWLPAAMEAPAPVSAYLHSATMVKAGVYLLARVAPVLDGTDLWMVCVTGVGATTMLAGAALALFEHDLKGILAYLTIAVLGTLVMLLGIGSEAARKAAMVYLLAHALYKAALFLIAGAIEHESGVRDIRGMGGLWRRMPLCAAASSIAALSMLGMIPLPGYLAKESLLDAAWHAPAAAAWLTLISVLGSALLVSGAVLVGWRPFFGRLTDATHDVHEPTFSMWLVPLALSVASVVVGLFPNATMGPLVEPAVAASMQQSVHLELKLWHGFNAVFGFSVAAVACGLLLYVLRDSAVSLLGMEASEGRWTAQALYAGGVSAFEQFARWQTRLLQLGYLRLYLMVIVGTMVVIVSSRFLREDDLLDMTRSREVRFHEAAAVVLVVVAACVTAASSSRLLSVAAVTTVGFGVAFLFSIFAAPDVAMTLIVVESLSTLLLVLVFSRLPKFTMRSSRVGRLRDATLAIAGGSVLTVLLLMSTFERQSREVSEYYVEKSYPEAHGHNVVNVILVDFRSFDTLGEVTVFAAAAAGAYGLLKRRREDEE